jgi:hypothetical protein
VAKSPKRLSKFAYETNLFKPEPPEHPQHVKSLFCGRAKELERGLAILRQFLDVKGRRSKKQDKRPGSFTASRAAASPTSHGESWWDCPRAPSDFS